MMTRIWMGDPKHLVFLEMILLTLGRAETIKTELQFFSGPLPSEGTVEYQINNGSWETICADNLTINDVLVICRHLGFEGANRAIGPSSFGVRDSSFTMSFDCDGDENTIDECTATTTSNCSSGAGGVVCYDDTYLGCFLDNATDHVLPGYPCRNATQQGFTSPCEYVPLTIDKCVTLCAWINDTEYAYAGVKNGNECFCGKANTDYGRHGRTSDGDCQSKCTGNEHRSCGGEEHIAVFKLYSDNSSNSNVLMASSESITHPTENTQASISTVSTSPSPTVSSVIHPSNTPQAAVSQRTSGISTAAISASTDIEGLNIAVIAGAVGGAAAVILICIIITIIALKQKRKHRKEPQSGNLQLNELAVSHYITPLYHDMDYETCDQRQNSTHEYDTWIGTRVIGESEKHAVTEFEAAKTREANVPPGCEPKLQADDSDLATHMTLQKAECSEDEENFSGLYAIANKPRPDPVGSERTAAHGDVYAVPIKPRKSNVVAQGTGDQIISTQDDVSALYALPDKTMNYHSDDDSMMTINNLYGAI